MAGPTKTLVTMLRASVYLSTVSVGFGEEMILAPELRLPSICIVPRSGPFETVAGYSKDQDPESEMQWGQRESIDVYCWGQSTDSSAQAPIDHVDAVESELIPLVLSAFQDQRMNQGYDANSGGLYYKPVNGRWESLHLQVNQMGRVANREGRVFILTFLVDKTFVMPPPPEVTNPTFTLTATINVPT